MPYLNQKDRFQVDEALSNGKLFIYLASLDLRNFAGHLNYLIFRTVKIWLAHNKFNYFTFATIIGSLLCCILEIYRKLIAPYEEDKEKQNGEVI